MKDTRSWMEYFYTLIKRDLPNSPRTEETTSRINDVLILIDKNGNPNLNVKSEKFKRDFEKILKELSNH